MRNLRTPSPAMVVACIALAVALSGASYAAIVLPRNSVGTPQLKKSAVISAKVKDRSLRAHDFALGQIPAGPPGPKGDAGESATRLFASVNSTCTAVLHGRGVVGVALYPTLNNRCDVRFDRTVSGCTPIATISVGTGEIRASTLGTNPAGDIDPDEVAVVTDTSAGAPGAGRSFNIAVFC